MSQAGLQKALREGAKRFAEAVQDPDGELRRERDHLRTDLGRLLDAVQDVAKLSHLMAPHSHHLKGVQTPDCPGCAVEKLIAVHRGVLALWLAGQR